LIIFHALSVFKAISVETFPRAIVILASQPGPLMGLRNGGSHSEVAVEGVPVGFEGRVPGV
jgi:hypothetical protein